MPLRPKLLIGIAVLLIVCINPINLGFVPKITEAQSQPLISAIAWSRDGNYVAVGYTSGRLEIRNGQTGQLVRSLVGHHYSISTLAWNNANTRLVSGGSDDLVVWNVSTGQVVADLEASQSEFHYVRAVSWNKDNSRIFVFQDKAPKTLQTWDANTYQLLSETNGGMAGGVEWSLSGNHVAIHAITGDATVFDPITFQSGSYADGLGSTAAGWSPGEQRIVSATWHRAIHTWNVPQGGAQSVAPPPLGLARTIRDYQTYQPQCPDTCIWDVTFSLSGNRIYSVAGSGEFAVWNANSTNQTPLSTTQLPGAPITAAAFNQMGTKLAYGDSAGTLHLVDVSTLVANETLATPLALFRPSDGQANLINLPPNASPNTPTADNVINYASGAPVPATGNQWVMGDWDGDGVETPGVYTTGGVFYTTNVLGPSSSWAGTWFGFNNASGYNHPVAGRFSSAANDCIGVTDGSNFPPYGIGFVLYYTCNLNGGAPPLTTQWLSVVLPDSQGHSGTFQFGAGDFNHDQRDSIAIRRGAYIAFTNVTPSANAEFSLAQYWGTPPNVSGEGQFVVGDWDANGDASFGVYYPVGTPNGQFLRRDDLLWNSGLYAVQAIGTPVGTTNISVTSWRLR